jgi:hypothetical protein
MKRLAIDLKSIIIGALVGIIGIMLLGSKGVKNGTFDTITANTIKIMNNDGKEIISLGSSKDEGLVTLKNKEGDPTIEISSTGTYGNISMFDKKNLGILLSSHDDGMIVICNKEGHSVIGMRSYGDQGQFVIFDGTDKTEWKVLMQHNLKGHGEIYLYDKDGKEFWSKSPQKR